MKPGDLVRIYPVPENRPQHWSKVGVIVKSRFSHQYLGGERWMYDILIDGEIFRSFWDDEFEVINETG